MTYIALLRGINVGGNSKVPMAELKTVFEALGCSNVRTYINSGNVIFTDERPGPELTKLAEEKLLQAFGFAIKTLVVDAPTLQRISTALPADWRNDSEMKCDVMFLWDGVNKKEVLEQLPLRAGIDKPLYVDGALLWCVGRNDVSKSGMLKLIGTPLYKQLTIRNCNTVRKLAAMVADL